IVRKPFARMRAAEILSDIVDVVGRAFGERRPFKVPRVHERAGSVVLEIVLRQSGEAPFMLVHAAGPLATEMTGPFAFAAMAKIVPPHGVGEPGAAGAIESGAAGAVGMGKSGMARATSESGMARAPRKAGVTRKPGMTRKP